MKKLLMLTAIITGFNFIINSGNCSNNNNTRFQFATNLPIIYEEDGEDEEDENNNNENNESSIQTNINNNGNLNTGNNNTCNNHYVDMEIEDPDFY